MAADEVYLDALDNDPLGFDTASAEPNLWRALTEAGHTVRTQLPALRLPVLMINGELDVFASPTKAAAFADGLQLGRAVCIPGGFHDIPNDLAHRQVASLIVEAADEWCSLGRVGESPVRSSSSAPPICGGATQFGVNDPHSGSDRA